VAVEASENPLPAGLADALDGEAGALSTGVAEPFWRAVSFDGEANALLADVADTFGQEGTAPPFVGEAGTLLAEVAGTFGKEGIVVPFDGEAGALLAGDDSCRGDGTLEAIEAEAGSLHAELVEARA